MVIFINSSHLIIVSLVGEFSGLVSSHTFQLSADILTALTQLHLTCGRQVNYSYCCSRYEALC